jgi:2-polyprenyl-3-methyl-5-hydroxy-6-metoxy-1,4-benzoquinol methylase
VEVSPQNVANIGAYQEFGDDSLRAWDPDGDDGRKYMLNPTILRMLGPLEGKRLLDAGCGQGYLSRKFASRGATVTGVELSSRLLGYAMQSEEEHPLGIKYFQRDLSRLGVLEDAPFDAVVANMVLLDISDWEAAMDNCFGAVKSGGLFIFTLLHPCWSSNAQETWPTERRVEINEYLQPYEVQNVHGVNYHRPLSAYLNRALSSGMQIVEIAEPSPERDELGADEEDIRWHIPNFVVVCLSTGHDQRR